MLNWSEEVLIKKFKDIGWTYVISDLNVEEIVGTAKKNCTKDIKTILEFKKLIKRKGNKLYAKWKGYNNSFNIWIVKKRHIANDRILSITKIFWRKSES